MGILDLFRNAPQEETLPFEDNKRLKETLGFIKSKVGEEQYEFIKLELVALMDELNIETPPSLFTEKTEGDFIYDKESGEEHSIGDNLPLEVIERMLKSGLCMFPFEMKRAELVQIFRNPKKWRVVSEDEELAEIVRANLIQVLPKLADDFTYSAMAYGGAFGEKVAKYETTKSLGVTGSVRGPYKKWLVFDKINFIHPRTLKAIRRTKNGKYNGFIQLPLNKDDGKDIVVQAANSLVVPYNAKFDRLVGRSFFLLMYPYWFWFEVILRSMVKYMQRMAAPVVLGRAPKNQEFLKPGSRTERIDAMTFVFDMAKNLASANAAILPSDVDRETNKYTHDLSYLSASDRGGNYIGILEFLVQMTFRAAMVGDRAFSQQSGGIGSYASSRVHMAATQVHNEMVLVSFMHYLNKYLVDDYRLYNRGVNGAPIWVETIGLNLEEREMMMKMMATGGNSRSVQDMFETISWRDFLESEGIPTLTEEEVRRRKEEALKEAVKNQQIFAKASGGPPNNQNNNDNDDNQPPQNNNGNNNGQQDNKAQQQNGNQAFGANNS